MSLLTNSSSALVRLISIHLEDSNIDSVSPVLTRRRDLEIRILDSFTNSSSSFNLTLIQGPHPQILIQNCPS